MKITLSAKNRLRLILGLVTMALLPVGSSFQAVQADPPSHAPAHGYRRNKDRDRDRNERWDRDRWDRDDRDDRWDRDDDDDRDRYRSNYRHDRYRRNTYRNQYRRTNTNRYRRPYVTRYRTVRDENGRRVRRYFRVYR